jgi:predicted PolB exonuclease-like 3'-5' exonuclease
MIKIKRLYFDIETSPNVVFSWSVGHKINLTHDNILQERAIICICYKWEGDDKVYSVQWNKGDDRKMLVEFMKVMSQADEVVGHNSDNFDIKWLRTRCLYHGIEAFPEYNSVDTYKFAKSYFRFNSNKLDYISKFLGHEGKTPTGYALWKAIVLNNDKQAMDEMVQYCKNDVLILEKVHKEMKNYTKYKTHVAHLHDGYKSDCPECASTNIQSRGYSISLSGYRKRRCQCQDCGKWFSVHLGTYNKEQSDKLKRNKTNVR